jgi:glycerol-3-phosphate dehydrogenase
MAPADAQVVVIGGGVVGCAVSHALARRGVPSVVLEASSALALAASGTNSGILHTGFDSKAGELETSLILRAAQLRVELLEELGVPSWRCGARLIPRDSEQRAAVAALAENADRNGVEARIEHDGSLSVPGESVTDPVAFTQALAGAAECGGATIRLDATVVALSGASGEGVDIELADGDHLHAGAAVNCAGLYADHVAQLAGDEHLSIYPRKGEFLVFKPPARVPLDEILLALPSALGKGVLVFPTIDGLLLAGPTAREREDKRDFSVESDARELIMERALRSYPALEQAEQIGAYAGLRPAGRHANYVIEPSPALPRLIHVAAIRSTGLSASLGIGEYVAEMLAERAEIELGSERGLPAPPSAPLGGHWWTRAARYHEQEP